MSENFHLSGEINYFSDEIEFHFNDSKSFSLLLQKIIRDHRFELGALNIIFCSDEKLLEMNISYLNHDYYTDILTFPMESEPLSGDLYISIDRVKENALNNNVDFKDELYRVIIHGVLHLVGYMDKSDSEIAVIRNMESKYLKIFGFSN
jgi:rRNA maturation RNase YbeY